MPRPLDVGEYAKGVLAGDRGTLARAITLVESTRADHRRLAQELLVELLPASGGAHRIGITGVPGVGKSTFIDAFGSMLTERGHRVAVLAVDPSSTRTGGSILGDKTRMARLAVDPAAFIRPSPTSGTLGGVAKATRETIVLVEAAGFDVVLVETVGVGQSEVEIAGIADTTLVLLAPGMGDGIQAAKAGILEIGDIFVINKADRDGANTTRRELRNMVGMRTKREDWTPPVVLTVATKGEGTGEVVDEIEKHVAYLNESGELARRRVGRARREIEALALATVQRRMGEYAAGADELAAEVAAGTLDPFAAASRLLDRS